MIKLFLPKKKFTFNHHTEVVDENGTVLFLFTGSFFQDEIRLITPDGTVLYYAKYVWGFKSRYDIYKGNVLITSVIAKSLFNAYKFNILPFIDKLSYEGDLLKNDFNILKDDVVVVTIRESIDKKYHRVIEVDSLHHEYLLMLMFTLIVIVDLPDGV
jgi:uncharacterized protein YxjI